MFYFTNIYRWIVWVIIIKNLLLEYRGIQKYCLQFQSKEALYIYDEIRTLVYRINL